LVNNRAVTNLVIAPGSTRRAKDELPRTGFAPGVASALPERPAGALAQSGGLEIEIPTLGIRTTIVGLEKSGSGWDVTWLGGQLGYLSGTAYPTFKGNSVITGHVYGADGLPGPFVDLHTLRWGDPVILHSYDQKFFYEVRAVRAVSPNDISAFEHKEQPWVTLVTCKDYDIRTDEYLQRLLVQAVLVKVE
jgi:LPXTG-site transpeptidase (sortase) family protein